MTAPLFESSKRVDLILIGARGQVGRALRQRLHRERAGIAERCGLDLRLLATFDRRGFAFDLEGLDEERIDEALAARTPEDAEALFRHRAQPDQTPTVVIDCTASDDIAQQYPDWLSAGLGVVTANKRGNARELSSYRRIQRAAKRGRAPYRFETTVGAAIPLLGPLRALSLRGERVLAIQGVLSGSLSYLLQRLHAGDALSQSLADAQALGYTEPDPGEDLRAEDLVRKLLVLAREAGFALEPTDVEVLPFLDRAASHAATWPQHAVDDDADWRERIAEAQAANLRWVMLAEVDASRARVGLRALPANSPFADLPAGQNLVRIETDLQRERPLWLGGPGAGPEVTAAGVLSDVIDAAAELAASRYSASTRRSVAA